MSETTHRAWVYSRVSGRTQEDNGSLDDQALSCHRYAQAHGYVVVGQTREVFSGGEMQRPEFDTVLARARAGEFDVVVADKVDRFTRAEAAETYATIYELMQAGVRVEVTEIDPTNPFADLIFSILTSLASHERKRIATRTAGGRRRNAEAGKLRYGRAAPYGYRLVRPEASPDGRARFVVDEEAAAVVRRCLTDIANGVTLRQVCKTLDAEGVETPSRYLQRVYGVPLPPSKAAHAGWQTTFLTRFYTNPTYWGERFTGMTDRAKVTRRAAGGRVRHTTKRTPRKLGDAETYPLPPDVAPALVSKDLAQAARARAWANYAAKPKDTVVLAPFALLRGFVVCGHCGGRLSLVRQRAKRPDGTFAVVGASYQCHVNFVRRDRGYPVGGGDGCPESSVMIASTQLDPLVWTQVAGILLNPDSLLWMVENALAHQDAEARAAQEKRARLLKQAAEAERRAENFEETVGLTSSREVRQRLVYQAEEARDHAATWRREADRLADVGVEAATVRAAAQDLAAVQRQRAEVAWNLAGLGQRQVREILRDLGLTVTVYSVRSAKAGETPRWEMALDFAGLHRVVTAAADWQAGNRDALRVATPDATPDATHATHDMSTLRGVSCLATLTLASTDLPSAPLPDIPGHGNVARLLDIG